jgi:transcriptional regulator with XRE-family HTH domain
MLENQRVANTSDRLREAMSIRGKTQADLVRITGLSKSTLSRYLSGGFEPKQNAVNKLAEALNVAEMWLWGYDVPKEKNIATNDGSDVSESKRQLLALAEQCSEEDAEKLLQMMQILLGKK